LIETVYKLLVVDDDEEVLSHIVEYFTRAGLEVIGVLDGKTALDTVTRDTFDLLITDFMLPKIDGFELAKRVRETLPDIPIILLTASDDVVATRKFGDEVDINDYLTKPFSLRELHTRVKILLGRSAGDTGSEDSPISHGRLSIDPAKREVRLGTRQVKLTRTEFDVLWLFASNPGLTFSRHHLHEKIWGQSYEGYSRMIDSYINRLRAKIEDNPSDPRMLLNVWGIGYKLSDDK
jgi:two-component system OmpR family response regulator